MIQAFLWHWIPMPKKTPVQSTGVLYGEGRDRTVDLEVILNLFRN